jgi:hypothetical protein
MKTITFAVKDYKTSQLDVRRMRLFDDYERLIKMQAELDRAINLLKI